VFCSALVYVENATNYTDDEELEVIDDTDNDGDGEDTLAIIDDTDNVRDGDNINTNGVSNSKRNINSIDSNIVYGVSNTDAIDSSTTCTNGEII